MAEPGDEIRGAGSMISFRETTEQTGGERVVVEISYDGGPARPPAHFHPAQEERFEVLEGRVHTIIDGTEQVRAAGESYTVAAESVHQIWSEEPARQRWETRPALRTERFFETLWGVQQRALAGETEFPDEREMALLFSHFCDEFRLAEPPPSVRELVDPTLRLIARARGEEG